MQLGNLQVKEHQLEDLERNTTIDYSDIPWYIITGRALKLGNDVFWTFFWLGGKLAENLKNHWVFSTINVWWYFHPADAGRGGISGNLDQGQQIAMLESKHEETEKLALQKALQHGVFAREALDEIPVFPHLSGEGC